MTRVARLSFAIALLLSVRTGAMAQQYADPEFDAKVDRPAFTDRHPRVLLDEAHHNFHTAAARYKPLADLLKSDGYTVEPNTQKFTADGLKGCAILVVANAQGAAAMRNPAAANPSFEPAECDAVHDWVQSGGCLLLIADHHPWGPSSERLAARLGVEMGKSTTFDPANSETRMPGLLVFSRVNGLIGDHPIMRGRDGSERIDRILAFTGQSLKGPNGSVALLPLSRSAVDQPRPEVPGRNGSAAGRAQGLAFTLGRGRVVVLGEAAMLSAQINRGRRVGMNVPGTDNRQFALNVMHWLSGVNFPVYGEMIAAKMKPSAKPGAKPATAAAPARLLSSAEIAAESEPSIALISGDGSVGTGFLVRPGIIATNAHVIDGEFPAYLKVRFPSAEAAQQGPFPTELLYEDTDRDLAFLRVKSSLPPLRIAASYKFRKGEDVTAIGNPGAGGELILENAISRGLMSTRTSLEGQRYYQLSIAVNPGNSGGPVFNSYGEVIGVVTRKSAQQEALAFCIPVEDLNLAIEKVDNMPPDVIEREQSRHRLILTVKELGGAGALYCSAMNFRRTNAKDGDASKSTRSYFDGAINRLERQTFPRMRAELGRVRSDVHVSQSQRDKVGQLADNLEKLKAVYAAKTPSKGENDPFANLRSTHRRLLIEVCKELKVDVPLHILFALGEPSEAAKKGGEPKDDATPKK